MEIGRYGVWASSLRYAEPAAIAQAAAGIERLGYGALWFPDTGGDVFGAARRLLAATERVVVATGILNIWEQPADTTIAGFAELEDAHPGRFLLGLGVSHARLIDRDEPGRYRRPLAAMRAYLDALDAGGVPADRRVIAALGPNMVQLAKERSLGTHPYNVPVQHTVDVRAELGDGPLVAPEQGVVVDEDPGRARAAARAFLERYAGLPNYANQWFRYGFTEADVAGGQASDALVDALVGWGPPAAGADRLRAHVDAGADHVCVQVLGAGERKDPPPVDVLGALARELGL